MRKMYGLLSALLIVSVLLTGCLGGGPEVDKRKSADEDITALIEAYAETIFRDANEHVALYSFPFELQVWREETDTITREKINNADKFAEFLEAERWDPDSRPVLGTGDAPTIYVDSAYKSAIVLAELVWYPESESPEKDTFTFNLKNENSKWLFSEYLFGVDIWED